MQEFKRNITAEEWDKLKVVIRGSHMARHGSIFMQYFGTVLDTRVSSGQRVVFAEGLDTKGAMDLLGTHVIDGSAGDYFWNRYVEDHRIRVKGFLPCLLDLTRVVLVPSTCIMMFWPLPRTKS